MKLELLCLKWGTWACSLLRLPHPWPHGAPRCLGPSLTLNINTCARFPAPNNMVPHQKGTTILSVPLLSWGNCHCCSIILLISSLALPRFNSVSLDIWTYRSSSLFILWPPHVNGGLEKDDTKSHMSHDHQLWKLGGYLKPPILYQETCCRMDHGRAADRE